MQNCSADVLFVNWLEPIEKPDFYILYDENQNIISKMNNDVVGINLKYNSSDNKQFSLKSVIGQNETLLKEILPEYESEQSICFPGISNTINKLHQVSDEFNYEKIKSNEIIKKLTIENENLIMLMNTKNAILNNEINSLNENVNRLLNTINELKQNSLHPNGQSWKEHWCASRETVCNIEELFGWKTCRYPFVNECSQFVSNPHL